MGLINRKAVATTLTETLAVKAGELRVTEASKQDDVRYFSKEAEIAASDASLAGRQAAAVEEAFAIIEKAGVTL